MYCTYLWLALATKSDCDYGEHRGRPERRPRRDLRAALRLGQPERHPRAHHDQSQGDVDLKGGIIGTELAIECLYFAVILVGGRIPVAV